MNPDISFTCKKSRCFVQAKRKTKKEGKQKTLSFTRSSLQEMFCKTDVLKNFAKFTGKHLCQSLSFNKTAGLRSKPLLKKDTGKGVFL